MFYAIALDSLVDSNFEKVDSIVLLASKYINTVISVLTWILWAIPVFLPDDVGTNAGNRVGIYLDSVYFSDINIDISTDFDTDNKSSIDASTNNIITSDIGNDIDIDFGSIISSINIDSNILLVSILKVVFRYRQDTSTDIGIH